MSLQPGSRIGTYEVVALIGKGGMGEVYRARDTRLQRDVAIKILPDLFAADPDRVARFEREAQTLAALNHPNIAQIHGVEGNALVMEFADGEDLAQRIARQGAIPVDEAIAIARQIADALAAAHERGIVHRDLKPANVKLCGDGSVKVLDFGLAKLGAKETPQSISNSPTFTSPALMTHAGIIIGTAAYMSPEQAKGKAVDRRADLWAFGVVLYEMLTGRAGFDGETITDVLAAVVTRDPDWTALPANAPDHVRRLLARCLVRDPKRRLADAGEAAYQLEHSADASGATVPPASAAPPSRTRRMSRVVPWAVAAVFAALAGVVLVLFWRTQSGPQPEVRYSIDLPPKVTLNLVARPAVAVSPDGRTTAFVGSAGGITGLYIRKATEFETRLLPDTEGASDPVFSPDGQWVAFFATNRLRKILVDGGSVELLADVVDPRGLSWDLPERIVFSPDATSAVYEVAPNQPGSPKQLTTLKPKVERTHRWPQLLPNGTLIFTVGSPTSPDNYDSATIEAQLPGGERKVLMKGASMARYVGGKTLVFTRKSSLNAVHFDPDTLEVSGTPGVVLQSIAGDATTGAMNFSASASGTLAYINGRADALHRLVWVAPGGKVEPIDLPPQMYFDPSLSPDGHRAAVTVISGAGSDVWVYDFTRKTFTRLTFNGSGRTPVWSSDSRFIYYSAVGADNGAYRIIRIPADGSGQEEPMAVVPQAMFVRDIMADGRTALVDYTNTSQLQDLALLPFGTNSKFQPLLTTEFDEYAASISPNGRWVAYQSNETTRYEIYVRDVAARGGRWQISTSGGEEPRWSADGRELFFRNDTRMMSARIGAGPSFQNDTPQVLFDGVYNLRSDSGVSYDVDPKGRFLMIRPAADDSTPASVRMILHWTGLTRQNATPRQQ